MKDLINRLREPWRMPEKKPPVMDEAADALEAQQAEIEALRAEVKVLQPVLDAAYGLIHGEDWNIGTHARAYRKKLIDAVNAARRK